MRVLGIDPGTGRCGFGIVEKHGNRIVPINYGVIETFKEQNSFCLLYTSDAADD